MKNGNSCGFRRPAVGLVASLLIGLQATFGTAFTPRQPHPNIVVIFADDLGYSDLGCYGATDIRTPRLDAMAGEGVRFTDFYVAASVCTPSRAALMTGCYPRRVGLTGVLHPHENLGLNAAETTVAELLHAAGYATGCFGKWHLGHRQPFLPHSQGFQASFVIPYSHDMYRDAPWAVAGFSATWPDHVPLFRNEEKVDELRGPEAFAALTERFTTAACEFLDRHRVVPFFLYLPLTLPHLELSAPAAFRGQSRRGPFGDAVVEIDAAVGRILDALDNLGLRDDTLVVFTSDNGPAVVYQQPTFPGGSAAPFTGGKASGFEGGVRVPCMMRWPRQIPAGRVCSAMCSAIDLLPTFALIADAGLPDLRIDGRSILPLLRDPEHAASPHEALLYSAGETVSAVRSGRYKLWLPDTRANTTAKTRLYDLIDDPAEEKDLSPRLPETVARLTRLAAELAVPAEAVRAAATVAAGK